MGLAVGIGLFGDEDKDDARQRDLAAINEALQARDLPTHEGGSIIDTEESRATVNSFPYSWLHYLRRFAAHVLRDPKWVPFPIQPGEDPAEDPVVRQIYAEMESHLLCHSDSNGYYVPIDFQELIIDRERLPGKVLGSSYQLRRELIEISATLEIKLDDHHRLSDEEARRVGEQRPANYPFAIERLVWLSLFEAARMSVEYDRVIVFK